PNEPCNVAKFQEMAYACMDGIYKRGNLPIIVGGTGFYIQSILYGISFEQEEADSLREQIEAYYREQGEANLWNRLEACDPVSAAAIHPNNVKRVIRAIEYYERTGTCISDHNAKEREKEPIYQGLYLVLTNERALLYETINERVDQMVSMGLFQEVERLLKKGYTKDMTSMQAIGYKEIIAYYEGNLTKDEAIDLIKQHTRHFAKRQMTWFRRERNVYMIDKSHYESEQEIVLAILDKWSKEYELL
ncbi:MAG: tRNA (adenosine(37)-N6)-dimethylallyltransferase MiaA, partial [Eubacteriales bacterium]